jgi:hypothetical protein
MLQLRESVFVNCQLTGREAVCIGCKRRSSGVDGGRFQFQGNGQGEKEVEEIEKG